MLDLSAFQRGDVAALSAFIEHHLGLVWRLARRGFVFCDDDHRVWVSGLHRPERLFELTVAVLSEALQPAQRAKVVGPEDAQRLLIDVARGRLLAAAQPEGRALTLDDDTVSALPRAVVDLDALGTGAELPALDATALEGASEEDERFRMARAKLTELVSHLSERDALLFERRLRRAEPRAVLAAELSQSVPAIKEGERRLVRHLLYQLRRSLGSATSETELERLVVDEALALDPPPRTAERIAADTMKRVFPEEPRPYSTRATIAFGALASALVLYALMFFGVLPGPGDDPEIQPEVILSCAPHCAPSMSMNVAVRAPARTRRLALWLRDSEGEVRPLLAETGGRPFALPLGAKTRRTTVAENVRFPDQPGPGPYEVVAVFSRDRPSLASLEAHVEGSRPLPKVVTHTSPVGP